jgi:signal transduction histidine kinase
MTTSFLTPKEQSTKIQEQLDQGFRRLMFFQPLENEFQQYQAKLIKRRMLSIGMFSLILLFLYAFVDFLFLPDSIWQFTIQVRAMMLFPVLLMGYLLINKITSPRVITYSTFFSYLWMGIGVITIIAGSQLAGYDLPYEGIYSVILFGFFLLGLPFKLILISTWSLWFLYGAVEVLVGHTEFLLPQLFFIASMCSIGTVGSYLQEHTLRTGYLKHQLIKLGQQQAIADREAKTQFLAAAGHDLRQPINAINLISDSLHRVSGDPHQAQMIHQLGLSVDMLNRLLDSLLEFSRLEMGEVTPHKESVDLDALVEHQVRAMTPQLNKANIKVSTDLRSLQYVNTDPLLLERIIKNLISNVIQHATASELFIQTQCHHQDVSIRIQDNGCGIPEQHLEAIFDQYYQITPNKERGMGLGLSIVKQLSHLLDVRLEVTSSLKRGTCFTLKLTTEEELESTTEGDAQKAPQLIMYS